MSKFYIKALNQTVTCELFDNSAPDTISKIKELFPYTVSASVDRLSGTEFYVPLPIKDGGIGNKEEVAKPGMIYNCPNRPSLRFYITPAKSLETELAVCVGKILDNPEGLAEISSAINKDPGLLITLQE